MMLSRDLHCLAISLRLVSMTSNLDSKRTAVYEISCSLPLVQQCRFRPSLYGILISELFFSSLPIDAIVTDNSEAALAF